MKTPMPPAHAMHPLLQMLTGGDRRSIGRSNDVVARVLKEPGLLELLFTGMLSDDPLLAMRCADAAEKISARRPELLKPHKTLLLGSLARAEQKELRWHLAPMLARLELSTGAATAGLRHLAWLPGRPEQHRQGAEHAGRRGCRDAGKGLAGAGTASHPETHGHGHPGDEGTRQEVAGEMG